MTSLDKGSKRRPPKEGLGGRMSLGALTFMGSMAATRVLGALSVAVLGRLLTPEDFGVVALVVFVSGALDAAIGRHFELALIRSGTPDPSLVGSAFALSAIWGVTAALALVATAGGIAALLDAPLVAAPLQVLAISPLIEGLRNPGFTLHEKNLRFGPPSLQEVAARFCATFVSLALALLLRSYWAMIFGLIAYSAVRAIISHLYAPVPARPTLSRWRELVGFSGWMIGTGVGNYLNRRVDRALIGGGLGVAEVGQYRMGDEITAMATSQIAQPFLRVVYPGLSRRSEDPERLRLAYDKAQGTILAALLPAGALAALTADDLLRVIVGEQWLPAALVIQVLAPLLALNGLTAGTQAIVYIRGDTRTLFLRNLFLLCVTVPLLWIGLAAGGFFGVILGRGASILIQTAMNLALAARVVGRAWFEPILMGWRSFAACAAMAAAVLAARASLPEATGFTPAAIRLGVEVAVGGPVYLAAHMLFWRMAGAPDGPERALLDLLEGLRARLRRRRS